MSTNAPDVSDAETPESATDPDSTIAEPGTPGGTTRTAYRWRYLSTAVTGAVVLVYSGLVVGTAAGILSAIDGGTWATYSLAFLAVIAYSVGVDTLNAARKTRQ